MIPLTLFTAYRRKPPAGRGLWGRGGAAPRQTRTVQPLAAILSTLAWDGAYPLKPSVKSMKPPTGAEGSKFSIMCVSLALDIPCLFMST